MGGKKNLWRGEKPFDRGKRNENVIVITTLQELLFRWSSECGLKSFTDYIMKRLQTPNRDENPECACAHFRIVIRVPTSKNNAVRAPTASKDYTMFQLLMQ